MAGKKPEPPYLKFVFGGTAGSLATCIVQPLDLVKNRMQLAAKSDKLTTFQCIKNIYQKEGFLAFYNGLSAGILRQCTYTTARLGTYNTLFSMYQERSEGKPPNFLVKVGLGITAGAVGAFVGTPAEISLIRMTADGRLPLAERRNYKNVFDAMIRIVREEGVLTLWRGAIPTMGRAMVVNAAQLATYSQAKEYLLSTGLFQDNIMCHFSASMVSGFVTTVASLPIDMAKTKIQYMKSAAGKPEFSGTVDVLVKTVKSDGVFALWRGFLPFFARLGPHTVLTFVFLEQLNSMYKNRP